MTSTFRLALDTHAPSVVWGGATGTTAGELLRVPYVSDEPLARAVLVLADARRLDVAVLPDHVEVLLPADAPDGPAAIEVRDDVGNVRLDAAVVQIAGTGQPPIVPPYAPQPSPGYPAPRRRSRPREPDAPEPRTVVVASENTVSTTVTSRVAAEVVARPAVSTTTLSSSSTRTSVRRAEVETAVSIRVDRVVTSDSGRRLEREVVVRRRDDPDTEALLLLL